MNGIQENSIIFQETIRNLQAKINSEIKPNDIIPVTNITETENCPFCGAEIFDYSIIKNIRLEIGFQCGLSIERKPGEKFITTSLCQVKQTEINKLINQFTYRVKNDFD